jgi:diguanylate cyclase (GGDEF)-like protein
MGSHRSGSGGILRKVWEGLTYPGYLTFQFKSARGSDSDPEFSGLNDALEAQRVINERVSIFADRAFEGALTSPLGAILLAWIGGSVAGWRRAVAWLIAFTVVEILLGRAGFLYRREGKLEIDALEKARRLIALSSLAGLVWGASAWVFYTENHFENYLLNLVILVGVSALSLLIMSPFLGAMISFFGGLILMPAIHAMTLASPLAWKVGVALAILYLLLLQFGSALGLHLISDIRSKVRSVLLAERLRLALRAAQQDWFDLNTLTGEMVSSNHHVGDPGAGSLATKDTYWEWLARIHPDDQRAAASAFGQTLKDSDAADVEYRLRQADGMWSWIRSMGTVVDRNEAGRPVRIIGIHSNISAAKAISEKVERLAFRDQLTDLPNRRLMGDRIHHALASAGRQHRSGALMILDMDDFKTLNDTLGHDVGDQFLREVATRLKRSVRGSDSVGRLGGDEYVVLLENLENGSQATVQVEVVAEKILREIREPYVLDLSSVAGAPQTYSYHCSASIGVSIFCGDSVSVDELYKRADTALYQAKAAGRNAVRFFDPAMQAEVSERAAVANDLREAVLKRQFALYFQPQVNASGEIVGSEALLRWLHPTRGVITPGRFIEIAETMGIIQPIGRWVIEQACTQLVNWSHHPESSHLTLAINISAAQFRDKSFIEHVMLSLAKTGASPKKLKFELTESLAMTSVEEVIEKMSHLKSIGVGFSLDDFGTGYSSLAYLKRLPIEELKIDQSFVRDAISDPNDAVIVRTIIALANAMGLEVIAEGVETEDHYRFLVANGCHGFQGNHFGRPMPVERFNEHLRITDDCAV